MQSVERIIKILDSFSIKTPVLSLEELKASSGLPKATVYRIAEALCEQHILEKDSNTRLYKIGIKLFELGSLYLSSMNLKDVAFAEMERLHVLTGETVHMGMLEGTEVISIEGLESTHSLHTSLFIGKRAPLHCTAIGKALLAFLPEVEREKIIDSLQLTPFTSKTITEKAELREELSRIRATGIAVDVGEHDEGIVCVGATIQDGTGNVVASISISGPEFRMLNTTLEQYSSLLLDTVARLSSKLGYRPRE